MATVYEERARVFKALCDERRQRILELLCVHGSVLTSNLIFLPL